MSRFVSEALAGHDRSTFASGSDRIDRYFRETVSQELKRGYARCFVLRERDTAGIAGFYTLSAYSIALTDLTPAWAKKLPRYPTVPAVLIGWLGRATAFRGQGIGSLLLYDAIKRVATAPVGAHALCADAIDEAAAGFFEAHQFARFASRPGSLYLPMRTALDLVGEGSQTVPD